MDPTIRQPGFDLLRRTCCAESLPHWPRPLGCKFTQVELGILWQVQMVQTMSYIVNECPKTMLSDGGLQRLHSADTDAVNWLEWIKNPVSWRRTREFCTSSPWGRLEARGRPAHRGPSHLCAGRRECSATAPCWAQSRARCAELRRSTASQHRTPWRTAEPLTTNKRSQVGCVAQW